MVILMMVYWLGYPSLLLVLVIGNNLLGWLYSAPPFRLNSSFIGELVLALGTGFTVTAVGFLVIMGQLSGSFLWWSEESGCNIGLEARCLFGFVFSYNSLEYSGFCGYVGASGFWFTSCFCRDIWCVAGS